MNHDELIERLKSKARLLEDIRMFSSSSAICHAIATLTDQAEEIERLRKALIGLKLGGCWCQVGVDNPMMGGRCSQQCKAAREALEEAQTAAAEEPEA